jgi:hypothetical protein
MTTHTLTLATPCPAWCNRDPEWHDAGDPDPSHATYAEVVTTGCAPGCRHHDEDQASPRNGDAYVSLDRNDQDGVPGQTLVTLLFGTLTGETHFTLDQAAKLADTLTRLVSAARGHEADI